MQMHKVTESTRDTTYSIVQTGLSQVCRIM